MQKEYYIRATVSDPQRVLISQALEAYRDLPCTPTMLQWKIRDLCIQTGMEVPNNTRINRCLREEFGLFPNLIATTLHGEPAITIPSEEK